MNLNPFGDPDVAELNPFGDPDSEGSKFFSPPVLLSLCRVQFSETTRAGKDLFFKKKLIK